MSEIYKVLYDTPFDPVRLTEFTGPKRTTSGDRRCLQIGDDVQLSSYGVTVLVSFLQEWLESFRDETE